jgi:pseudouridine synthase
MSTDRLQKLLARAGVASRRGVEDLIRAGRVTVNGAVAELGQKADPATDHVKVDGKRIPLQASTEPIYLLLHKPDGVMSTVQDPEGRPTVMDLIPQRLHKALVPVGRLDFHSTGLLLLTNDGDFAHRVGHPRYGCTKRYEVKVKGEPTREQLEKLRRGVYLDGRRTAPATVERRPMPRGKHSRDHTWWRVELVEGRNRQIREMFQRIGHPVQRLRRVAIGPVTDPRLAVGQYRELIPAEVEALTRATKTRATKTPVKKTKSSGPRAKGAKPKGAGKPGPQKPDPSKGRRRSS